MPDNVAFQTSSPATIPTTTLVAARSVTYSGDASALIAPTGLVAFAGSDDAKTAADIGGDATNGLDVDVTRLPSLVAGTANIGKVSPATAATATLANVSASASSVTLLASNSNRLGAVIANDSTATLYVKYGTTASATSFTYKLAAGDTLELPIQPIYIGILTGIWSSATGAARTTELTA